MIKMDVYNQPIEVEDEVDCTDINVLELVQNRKLKLNDMLKTVKLPTSNYSKPIELTVNSPLSFDTDTLVTELMRIDNVTEVKWDDTSLCVYCGSVICKAVDLILRGEQFEVEPFVIYIRIMNDSYTPSLQIVKQSHFNYDDPYRRFDDNAPQNSPHPNISNNGFMCNGDENLIDMYSHHRNLPMLIVSIIDFMEWCFIASSYWNPFLHNPCESCPYDDNKNCHLCVCYDCEFCNSYQCNNCDREYTIHNVYNQVYGSFNRLFIDTLWYMEKIVKYNNVSLNSLNVYAQNLFNIFNDTLDSLESDGIIITNKPNDFIRTLTNSEELKARFDGICSNIESGQCISEHTEFEIMEIAYKTLKIYENPVYAIKNEMYNLTDTIIRSNSQDRNRNEYYGEI